MAEEIDLIRATQGYYKHGGDPPKRKFYEDVLGQVSLDGLWLEFGMGMGNSTAQLYPFAKAAGTTLYAFDWFKGLPEEWKISDTETLEVGAFHIDGRIVRTHFNPIGFVVIVEGLFQDTLEPFLESHPGPAAFIHIDCDLYSSTKFVLETLSDRIVPGTVIIFDEFYNYPYYKEHEYKAWMEMNREYEYLGHVVNGRQVALKVL